MANITTGKITIGEHTMYLRECPNCGRQRDIGQGAMMKGVMIGAVLVSLSIVGFNIFSTLGIIQALIAGSVTANVAVRSIEQLHKMNKQIADMGYFKCPSCGCTKLFKD